MVSRNKSALGLPTQFSKIFANVDYIIMGINTQKTDISFVSHVVFHQENSLTGEDFAPEFTEYFKSSTMAYLEFGPIA
jgi:sulfatase maturation enzyme AslB (radical SAM superfamily)